MWCERECATKRVWACGVSVRRKRGRGRGRGRGRCERECECESERKRERENPWVKVRCSDLLIIIKFCRL